MKSLPASHRFALFAAALSLAGCGGGDSGSAEDGQTLALDSAVVPLEREPLTDADFAGLDPTDLVLELPWTSNRASRDPAPDAGAAWLEKVEVSGSEGYDRVLFTFSELTVFPGYTVQIAGPGTEVTCGPEGDVLPIEGAGALVVRLTPSSAHEETGKVRVPVRTGSLGHARLLDGGLRCDEADEAVWMAQLNEGAQIRVLEFANPQRLAIDVR